MTGYKTDRLGGLALGGLVVLAALWVATMAYGAGWEWFCGPNSGPCEMGGCESCQPVWPGSLGGIAAWAGGVLVLLGAFWVAWRLGSGRWSLRRRRAGAA